MASIERNLAVWDRQYSWPDGGDEWSSGWGGPEVQWTAWLEPRLDAALAWRDDPTTRVVEIGCGHGRWTAFLADRFERVHAIDLSPRCVSVCERRFADTPGVTVSVGDGTDLPGVQDASVDLVVSVDSLVHADRAVMESYLRECARVLTPDGVALLHHSNLAACGFDRARVLDRAPLRRIAAALGLAEPNVHWRDPTVDADVVVDAAAPVGLACVHQELLRWGTRRRYTDCISALVRADRTGPGGPRREWCDTFVEDMGRAAHRDANPSDS
jgi:SAM-dependent methyltransferase